MVTRTVAAKMGLKAGARAFLWHAPRSAVEAIAAPELTVAPRLAGRFDYLHLFALSQEQLNENFPLLKEHLKPGGILWVSWPKRRQLGTDLTLREVIRIGYSHGLVESTTLSVDETWSAMKFTFPVEGRIYRNSYGTLPGQGGSMEGGRAEGGGRKLER